MSNKISQDSLDAFEYFWDNFVITGDTFKDTFNAWKYACNYEKEKHDILLQGLEFISRYCSDPKSSEIAKTVLEKYKNKV